MSRVINSVTKKRKKRKRKKRRPNGRVWVITGPRGVVAFAGTEAVKEGRIALIALPVLLSLNRWPLSLTRNGRATFLNAYTAQYGDHLGVCGTSRSR